MAAISYDRPEVLKHFAERVGEFSYPLISDPKSDLIRAFGILNTNVPEDHEWFGMTFPGTYIVDENGVVTAKFFEQMHRQRFTADSILVKEFGVGGGSRTEVTTDYFTLSAFPAQNDARRGNRITLVVEMSLPERMHVYAPGVRGYRPLSLRLATDPHIQVHETEFAEPTMLHLEAIQETVPVYEGATRIHQDVTISPRLPRQDPDGSAVTDLTIEATLSYQACDDKVCYLPAEAPLRFTLEIQEHDTDRVPEKLRKKAGPSSDD